MKTIVLFTLLALFAVGCCSSGKPETIKWPANADPILNTEAITVLIEEQ